MVLGKTGGRDMTGIVDLALAERKSRPKARV